MIRRRFLRSAFPALLLAISGCATTRATRHFQPAGDADALETREALTAAQRRAATLPAARLLYDAHMASRGAPALPGTLAVTYDGETVRRASLTGPFGARVAEYADGAVTGEDRRALVVDPAALRAVLAGIWPGEPSSVEGCDGADCLVEWETPLKVSAVVDRKQERVRTLEIEGHAGRLEVTYGGRAEPWPERVAAREEASGRSLKLKLVTIEAADATPLSR